MKIRVLPAPIRGNTLVLTVITMGLVGFVLVAYLTLVKTQQVSVARSQAWNAAIPLIEAGIEDALTHLHVHGPTNLLCDGWSQAGGYYFIRRNLGDGYYVVLISNWTPGSNSAPVVDSRAFVSMPLLASAGSSALLAAAGTPGVNQTYLARGVRVNTRPQGLFTKAMVARGQITLSGGVRTDSFDSTSTNYSTNGRYDPDKARDNGDVASNGQVIRTITSTGNVKIYGRLSTGPGGTVNFTGNAAAGSRAWVDAGNTGVQPGYFADDMNVSFPDADLPAGWAPQSFPPNNYNGTNYDLVLLNGQYELSSLSLSGQKKVMVAGQAELWVKGNLSMSGQSYIAIAPGASLKLYVGRKSGSSVAAALTGQGVFNYNGNARNFVFYGLPTCRDLSLSGNAELCGVIYAPNAAFTMSGGGSSNVDFVGASITGTVNMTGSYNFHYDESLAKWGPTKSYTVTAWNEMTPEDAATLPAAVAAALAAY